MKQTTASVTTSTELEATLSSSRSFYVHFIHQFDRAKAVDILSISISLEGSDMIVTKVVGVNLRLSCTYFQCIDETATF